MEIFDLESQNYDSWYETKLGHFVDQIETQAVFDLLTPEENMKILDVGCGTGNYSIKLAKLNCIVTGIDISEEMLKIAKRKSEAEQLPINFVHGNIESMPFESNSFDAVISVAVLEFVNNKAKAFEEIFRVVKPKGKIVVGFLNKESPWGELYLSDEFQKNTVFKYAYLYTREEISKIHSEELVKIKETLFTPPWISESEISFEKEKEFSKKYNGGFLVALWMKK
ncbi:class I SAM-dependent methyltransferase [Bacteroidetes/Chlorobi group bacterium Naka2016]|jgi:ubiquinone biosynthesis O-methyltransferase|nr:MAG: class I SAM-dependent methyltransferase [Bacteroidetes/Chlorobi group bacterium Naka2016]